MITSQACHRSRLGPGPTRSSHALPRSNRPRSGSSESQTLVIGAEQAGLVASYWLARHGVEHQVLERQDALCGEWQDRWDSLYLAGGRHRGFVSSSR
ncbi:NAD(P)-binding protein [Arthrobacter oryzae]|uniref:NAD(P)-binding protein n=1 Tax=Arthrobacter oryzae TaxID=409290 RepID=UPI00286C6574|nr:NAD(P)-binding protein [Arthrobacter oryzae]